MDHPEKAGPKPTFFRKLNVLLGRNIHTDSDLRKVMQEDVGLVGKDHAKQSLLCRIQGYDWTPEAIRYLIKLEVDVNEPDQDYFGDKVVNTTMPLISAIKGGILESVVLLHEAGARDQNGGLHGAAQYAQAVYEKAKQMDHPGKEASRQILEYLQSKADSLPEINTQSMGITGEMIEEAIRKGARFTWQKDEGY